MLVSSNVKYAVQLADLKRDRGLIVDLWSKLLHSHTPEEHCLRFDWHYGANPSGKARCFLIRHEPSGQVIGTSGVGFRKLQSADGGLEAGIAIDFAIQQEHRTLLPAIMLARQVASLVQHDFDVIYGIPNTKAIGVFQHIGFRPIGRFQRFVYVLDADSFLVRKKLLARSPIPEAVNFGLRARELLVQLRFVGYRLREITWSDERVAELCKNFPKMFCVNGERSLEYLEWRFHRCPLHQHRILGLFREGSNTLLGYVVVYVNDGQVKVPDFLVCAEQHTKNLFAALVLWARHERYSCVTFEAIHPSHSMIDDLKACGYFSRGESDTLVAITKREDLNLPPWYLLRGDEFYNTF